MKLHAWIGAAATAAGLLAFGTAAQADDLAKIRDAGKMSVALSGAFPPMSFVDENNAVVGFDVDIGSELARRIGVEPEIVTTAWDGIIAGLVTGRYDTIVGSMGITDERKESVDFVGPYYRSGLAVFVLADSPVQSIGDLSGKTVGVNLGELAEQWATERGGWTISTYKGLPELYLELKAGRIDAFIADDVPVLVAANAGEPFRQIKADDLPIWDIGIAIRKGNPELAAALQKALDDMMADGTYMEISNKWIGADMR
jgi:ABC-type amino acid transport substrate-binding protein